MFPQEAAGKPRGSEIWLLGQRKRQYKCVPAHATTAEALPQSLTAAEKPTFCVNVSSLAIYVYIREIHFSARFCKSQIHHLHITNYFQGRELEGLLLCSNVNCKGQWVMPARFSDEFPSEWSSQFPWTQTVWGHNASHQSCPPMPTVGLHPPARADCG